MTNIDTDEGVTIAEILEGWRKYHQRRGQDAIADQIRALRNTFLMAVYAPPEAPVRTQRRTTRKARSTSTTKEK